MGLGRHRRRGRRGPVATGRGVGAYLLQPGGAQGARPSGARRGRCGV